MFLKIEKDLITAWLLPLPSFESDSLKDLSLSVPGSSASSYCYSNIQRPVSSFRSSGQGGEGTVEGCVASSSGDGSIVRGVVFIPPSYGSCCKIPSCGNAP